MHQRSLPNERDAYHMSRRAELRDICEHIIPSLFLQPQMPLPEVLKRTALHCFIHDQQWINWPKGASHHIREALLELEETGMISDGKGVSHDL